MRRFSLILLTLLAFSKISQGQTDMENANKGIDLYTRANKDIEDGNYESAVEKLVSAAGLYPQLRDIYLSLNTACTRTNQTAVLKKHLQQAKTIFKEDDEFCYYLGNVYQNEKNLEKAIQEYTLAIQYCKKNGEDYDLAYAYYLNRANCYLKRNEYSKAIPDLNYAIKLNSGNGATYANRGIAYYQIGKKTEACQDWKKAKTLGESSVSQYINKFCK